MIPSAVAVGNGSVWLAVPDTVDPRGIAVWRVDPLTVRVTQTVSIGKGSGYPPTLELTFGAGAIWVTNFDDGTPYVSIPNWAQ